MLQHGRKELHALLFRCLTISPEAENSLSSGVVNVFYNYKKKKFEKTTSYLVYM